MNAITSSSSLCVFSLNRSFRNSTIQCLHSLQYRPLHQESEVSLRRLRCLPVMCPFCLGDLIRSERGAGNCDRTVLWPKAIPARCFRETRVSRAQKIYPPTRVVLRKDINLCEGARSTTRSEENLRCHII